MKIIKYDRARTTQTSGGSSNGGGGGSSTTIQGGGSVELNRTIWGKQDVGEDIDGTMTVNGNININVISNSFEEDDEGGEDEEYEEGGGNLNVELKTTTKELEVTEDAYIQNHLYVNHSHSAHSGDKVCLISEVETNTASIKTNKDNIATNKTEINALKTRVSTAETNITNLQTNVTNNTTNISNNADDISDLQDQIDNIKTNSLTEEDVLKLINDNKQAISDMGSYSQPVVLWAGRCRRVSYLSDSYYMEGIQIPYFTLKNKIDRGLMTIEITPMEKHHVNVYSVSATQERSGDTADITATRIVNRNEGAHWMEARVDNISNTKYVYVREFHQGNGDNDTWYSDNFMESDASIQAFNLIIIGYVWREN